jgi:CubicO group peptidase (beta-lactamase class C family)
LFYTASTTKSFTAAAISLLIDDTANTGNPLAWNTPLVSPGEPTGFRGSHIYALGLAISNYRGEVMIWHSGGLPGFGTVMAFLPRLE